jgi:molybdopterin/thiamine biosynthesis adenylyltransferase
MTHLSTIRHDAIFDPIANKDIRITIIGAGATGSRLWLTLVELGVTNLAVYDFDHVESHNLANQIYHHKHLGMPKVDALASYYVDKTGQTAPASMAFYNDKVTADSFLQEADYVFLMTDTIESRIEIANVLYQEHGVQPKAVIETRMASTHGNVVVFDKASQALWEHNLPDPAAPEEVTACGSSISVGVTASGIASHAVWAFLNRLEDDKAVVFNGGSPAETAVINYLDSVIASHPAYQMYSMFFQGQLTVAEQITDEAPTISLVDSNDEPLHSDDSKIHADYWRLGA